MHIHILGICGTFMGGIAVLAKQQGHHVTGSDLHVYPPMSTQLQAQGIALYEGFEPSHLQPAPDIVVVGNALSRGNPVIEYLLISGIPYTSGPQWLAEHILQGRHVLAVAGTHGKTTTSSLLAWILECAKLTPGFLIGGIPENFSVSARLGKSPFFVVEADEYDSAFFDKRSKFIHYRSQTVILNNLEFDHADIFPNLAAIQRQFHHWVRTVPGSGKIICAADDENLQAVLVQGCWTPVEYIGLQHADWHAQSLRADGSEFSVYHRGRSVGTVSWNLLGQHNICNALAAIAGASHVGVMPEQSLSALSHFSHVKRRMEKKGEACGITVYDDFAHHPTAIATTLAGLRGKVGAGRIVVVLELGSYTMRTGAHRAQLVPALAQADSIFFMRPRDFDGGIDEIVTKLSMPVQVFNDADALMYALAQEAQRGDHIVVMSNTGFSNEVRFQHLLKSIAQEMYATD